MDGKFRLSVFNMLLILGTIGFYFILVTRTNTEDLVRTEEATRNISQAVLSHYLVYPLVFSWMTWMSAYGSKHRVRFTNWAFTLFFLLMFASPIIRSYRESTNPYAYGRQAIPSNTSSNRVPAPTQKKQSVPNASQLTAQHNHALAVKRTEFRELQAAYEQELQELDPLRIQKFEEALASIRKPESR